MDILINLSDLEFIVSVIGDREIQKLLTLAKHKGEFLEKDRYSTGKYFVRLSEDGCRRIQDGLGDYLAEFGIGDDGEVNSVGKQVDTLIDSFQR